MTEARLDIESPLHLRGNGVAWFTGRARGSLSPPAGRAARERLRTELGLSRLVGTRQVHGARVVPLELLAPGRQATPAGEHEALEADGRVTALAGAGVLALAADCLPIALGNAGGVGVIHAGWRGVAAGVIEEGVHALARIGGSAEMVAVIGPGAGPCCYEVGPEVHHALGIPGPRGPLDLKAAAARRLRAAGVADVHDLGLCTICDERFFSHRREGVRAGRHCVVAWRETAAAGVGERG